jgi:hypothetical protein
VKRFEAPGEREARDRAWRVVRAAYEGREPVAWPRRHVRPMAAGALVAAALAAALSPPGRSVIHSLRKAVGVQHAAPELLSLPTSGRLLVNGPGGTWVVNRDGSRRRLGNYRDATWSPHGLFIAATQLHELVALDPKGNKRWTLPRRSPRSPSWTGTRTDTRIAYLSNGRLRVVGGDGKGDVAIGPAAGVAPVWRPGAGHVVAYATPNGDTVVYDVDRGSVLLRKPGRARKLAWSRDGRLLLVFRPYATRVYDAHGRIVARDDPPDATFDVDAAFVGKTHEVVAIRAEGLGSNVFSLRDGHTVFRGTGAFQQLAWSPDGRWLLVTWQTANQWVFVRPGHPRRIVGASRITAQFGGFPRVSGWCCAR